MELNVDTLIHEVGAGGRNQFYAHPLGLADSGFSVQAHSARNGLRHNMYATFMAKPIATRPAAPCMCAEHP
jgi:glutamine synthetase